MMGGYKRVEETFLLPVKHPSKKDKNLQPLGKETYCDSIWMGFHLIQYFFESKQQVLMSQHFSSRHFFPQSF